MSDDEAPEARCGRFGHTDVGDGVCWCGSFVYYVSDEELALSRAPGTVCVRLDGLADKIAAEISRHRWRTGIGRCECGKPVDAYMREHVAASLLALLQSLAVQ